MANPAAIQKPAAIIVAFKVNLQLSVAAAHAAIARAGQRRGSSLWRTVGDRRVEVANVPPTRAIRRDNGARCGFTVPRREQWRRVRPAGCPSRGSHLDCDAKSDQRDALVVRVRIDVLMPRTPGRARPGARRRRALMRAIDCTEPPSVARTGYRSRGQIALTYGPASRTAQISGAAPAMTSSCQAFAHQAAPVTRDSIANIGPHKTEQGSRRRDARREDDRHTGETRSSVVNRARP